VRVAYDWRLIGGSVEACERRHGTLEWIERVTGQRLTV